MEVGRAAARLSRRWLWSARCRFSRRPGARFWYRADLNRQRETVKPPRRGVRDQVQHVRRDSARRRSAARIGKMPGRS